MPLVHLSVGEEAIAVGVCAHRTDKDDITSTHRGHGHCIAKGVDVKRMMAELYGRTTGTNKGKGGSMHIADTSVGMLGASGSLPGASTSTGSIASSRPPSTGRSISRARVQAQGRRRGRGRVLR